MMAEGEGVMRVLERIVALNVVGTRMAEDVPVIFPTASLLEILEPTVSHVFVRGYFDES
jgi:hypothetical protein